MAAKAYPRRMNCAIAESMVQRLVWLQFQKAPVLRGQFSSLQHVVAEIREARIAHGQTIGLDFAGDAPIFSAR